MNEDISQKLKETRQEAALEKTQQIGLTLKKKNVLKVAKEMRRLGINNRSLLINVMIETYFDLPIKEDHNENTNQSPKTKFSGSEINSGAVEGSKHD